MKKFNKYLLLLATAVFAFTACEKQVEREPSPAAPANAIAFEKSSILAEINPNKAALEFEIRVTRSNTADAQSVAIAAEGDIDIINVPAKAEFAAGENATILKLTFPNAEVDSTYSVVLSVAQENQSPYLSGVATCAFTVSIASWEQAAAPAVMVDGFVASPFGLTPIAWYVNFLEKTNADGSKDYRFLNPYRQNAGSEAADNFDVYSWFVVNSGEEVDLTKDYHWEIHVNADGTATFPKTYLGPDYGYGPALIWMTADFFAQRNGTDPDYETYGIGIYNDADKSITFPAGSYFWYFDGYGGNMASLPQIIYLDSKAYQDNNLSIKDYNAESIEWVEQESVINQFESTIFNFINDEQKLFKAVDQYEGNPKSPFINLYCLKDAYAEGGNLAFYWNGEDGEIEIPANQNTKLSFMQQELFIAEGAGQVVTTEVKGTKVKVFTFNLVVVSAKGNEVGEFVETFSIANEAIVFAKEDFIGNFTLAGYSQFTDAAETVDVTIAEEGDKLVLHGILYCSGLVADFDAEKGTLSIAPQLQDSVYGAYDIAFYTTTSAGPSAEAALEFGFGLSGVAKLTADSEADGYLVRSEAAGGWLAGHYDLTLTPAAPAPAPAKVPAINRAFDLKNRAFKAANTPSVSHLSIQNVNYRRTIRCSVVR